MAQEKPRPQRGLPAIAEARELRQSRSQPAASGKFWLWSLLAIVAITIFYWKKTQSENDAHRAKILAKQRSIAASHGGTYADLRDRVEKWTAQVATGGFEPDLIAPAFKAASAGARTPPIFEKPGIYLRVLKNDARSPKTLREAAQESLRDAFTACLVHKPHLTAPKGQTCKKSKDCPAGQLCNEASICALPAQPFNMRMAYRGLRVLSEEWVRSVETTSEALTLRLYETDIDDATANDLPVVNELLKNAEYFLVVIDEVPEGLKPPPEGTLIQAVQSEVHPTRVALFDLRSREMLFRLHRTVDVTIPATPGDAATIDAQRRQILNCALAQEVRAALGGG